MLLAEKSDDVLTVPEVAHILRVNRNSIYQAIRRGELPAVRLGRKLLIPRAALERLLTPTVKNGEIRNGTPRP